MNDLLELVPASAAPDRRCAQRVQWGRIHLQKATILLACAVTGVLAAVPAPSHSQTAQPSEPRPADVYDDRIVVRETTVYVRVRSRRGPLTGLEQQRFTATIGNTQLPIVDFQELKTKPSRKRRTPDPPQEEEPLLGRNLLVVFDARFTPRPFLIEAVRSVRRSLDDLGSEDRMAVALWTDRARLILPYSNDPTQLEAAFIYLAATFDADTKEAAQAAQLLDALSDEPVTQLRLGLRAELTRRTPSVADSIDFSFVNRFGTFDPAESLQGSVLAESNELSGLLSVSNSALADLARALSDVSGPRHALLFGRGVPGFQNLIQGRAAWDAGTISSITRSFNELTYRLRGNGWVVDTVDVTGVGGRSTSVSMADSSPRSFNSETIASQPRWVERGGLAGNDSDSLFLIAEQTGGRMYDNLNNLRDALRQSLDASSHAYRLVVRIPDTVRLEGARGAVAIDVAVSDLPARASIRSSFAADWAIPAHLRRPSEVEDAHAELLGTQPAQPLPPLLARMTVHRRADESGPRLQRALVALDADMALPDGAREVSLIAVASPIDALGGDGSIFDLWTEQHRLDRDDRSAAALLAYADLLVPCSGARIRFRLATDGETSWVAEQVLDDACAGTVAGAILRPANSEPTILLGQTAAAGELTGSRARLTVLAGGALDATAIDGEREHGDTMPFLLTPQSGDGPPIERLAVRSARDRDGTGTVFTLTFDVAAGHYLVRPTTAPPETAVLVSVF